MYFTYNKYNYTK